MQVRLIRRWQAPAREIAAAASMDGMDGMDGLTPEEAGSYLAPDTWFPVPALHRLLRPSDNPVPWAKEHTAGKIGTEAIFRLDVLSSTAEVRGEK